MTQAAAARQAQAADPASSTWLSANAGSGKTKVLTDRVARLLLAGVPPQRILCLTYTKAAASEMQNRLFQLLGRWTMRPDAALRAELRELGEQGEIDAPALARARRLFARAIETPGGLKVQTIHSFCASLLRRFPLEAGVSPQFVEMDDRAATLLREEVVEEMAAGATLPLVDAMAAQLGGGDFVSLTAEIASHRAAFAQPLDRAQAMARFGLPPDTTAEGVVRRVLLGDEGRWWPDLLAALAAGSSTDRKAAALLARGPGGLGDLAVLEQCLLTGSGAKEPFTAKIGGFPTKATRAALGEILPALEGLMARVEEARPIRLGLAAAGQAQVLHAFAAEFLRRYARHKAERAWLDFDDLILGAARMLTDASVAQWVLYRLDGGIDHILVDEAQDTSPAQWQVIALLAQEFTAGLGARDVARTIFVVGDKKQSIYSFQGADLGEFDRMQAEFARRLAEARLPLAELALAHSFRSSPVILGLVDQVFSGTAQAGVGGVPLHIAHRPEMAGRVDLWPLVPKAGGPDEGDWFDPVDRVSEQHHAAVLAGQIAAEIRRLLDAGTAITVKGVTRPLGAGDVLILVQRRSELFHQIIRACKAAGLPVAGADRLKLGGELAVRDLAAVLSFLALDADDLSLAAALRSPLFGWTEGQLYDLAAGRGRRLLWETMRETCAETEAHAILRDLRDASDFLRPYDLIERILTRHDGRRKLIARLGPEAEDGIDSLLSQALAYERMDVPSLTGFLVWLESGEVEVKRRPDAAGDRIRVMTVHGAKGLEAPMVILPDTMDRRPNQEGRVIAVDGAACWRAASDEAPPQMAAAKAAQAERIQQENLRLLYVALTRAQSWLVLCGAGDKAGEQSWYGLAEMGVAGLPSTYLRERLPFPPGEGVRLSHGAWPAAATRPDVQAEAALLPEEWMARPAPRVMEPPAPLRPSDLGGPKALAGDGSGLGADAAMERGSLLHLLFEHLPGTRPETWPALAERLLGSGPVAPGLEERAELLAEASAVLQDPALSALFAGVALAEVEISADLDGQRMIGSIDRLLVGEDTVLAIDFKSNALVPDRPEDVPTGILRQMRAYAVALRQIYPEKRIDLGILWTRVPRLMMLPPDVVCAMPPTTTPA